ncbi:hypothetical protein Tco_0257526 [Tanacetum coccineum]
MRIYGIQNCKYTEFNLQLDEWGMKAWLKFKQNDAVAKITAHDGIMYLIDKKIITRLSKELTLFCFIADFAIQAFNKSYQLVSQRKSDYLFKLRSVARKTTTEPFEEPLTLSVKDRVGPNKDDVLERCMFLLQYVAINTRRFNLEKHVMVVEGEKKKEVISVSNMEVSLSIRNVNQNTWKELLPLKKSGKDGDGGREGWIGSAGKNWSAGSDGVSEVQVVEPKWVNDEPRERVGKKFDQWQGTIGSYRSLIDINGVQVGYFVTDMAEIRKHHW